MGYAAMVLVNLVMLLLLVTSGVLALLGLFSRINVGLPLFLSSADLLRNIMTCGLVDALYRGLLMN